MPKKTYSVAEIVRCVERHGGDKKAAGVELFPNIPPDAARMRVLRAISGRTVVKGINTHQPAESKPDEPDKGLAARAKALKAAGFSVEDVEEFEQLQALNAMIRREGVDPRDVEITSGRIANYEQGAKVNTYDPLTGKRIKQEVVRTPLKAMQVKFEPRCAVGPKWQTVDQPPRIISTFPTILIPPPSLDVPRAYRAAILYSDTQHGFSRPLSDPTLSTLVPFHDNRALDIALQISADIATKADRVKKVHMGDGIDANEMSRWQQHEEFFRTTQPAIDAYYEWLWLTQASTPEPRDEDDQTVLIKGNHDRRFRDYIQNNARAAYGIRKAKALPEDWPVFTVENLCRFDELKIKPTREYPAGEVWLHPGNSQYPPFVCRHDPKGKGDYDADVAYGHTHTLEHETFSRRGYDAQTETGMQRHFTTYGVGCLCRTEDAVEDSLMPTRIPSDRAFVKNWAQGFVIVWFDREGHRQADQVHIKRGRATFHGRTYTSHIDLEAPSLLAA